MRRRWPALWVWLLLVPVGCSQTTRDRWLRTFFDDPPVPQKASVEAAGAALAGSSAPARAAEGWVHAPYAAGDCNACHFLSSSRTYYRGSPARGVSMARGTAGQERTRLQAPLEVLCLRCHDDFSPAAAQARGLWVHAPVAAGECAFCHDPHRSGGRFLLKAATAAELCGRCHDDANLNGIPGHAPRGPAALECTRCHVPHAATGRDLLRGGRP